MEINIIRGAIGSGKSDKCMEMIAMTHRRHPSGRCIMLVPNHSSYETEKRFVDEFGGTGLNNIEVMTLRRLAMTLLTNREMNYITDSGRQMLIHRAIAEYCRENADAGDKRLMATIRKPGFCDVMTSLISEFKRYAVTPEELYRGSSQADEKLKSKMCAAAEIYEIYSRRMEETEYTDSEDDNARLAEHILSGDYFNSDTYLWVDKFNELTPCQADVLRAAAKKGAQLTITVSYPPDNNPVYEPMKSTMSRIDELTDEFGVGRVIDMGNEFKNKKSPETEFLLKNWGRADVEWKENNGKTENIVYFSARDIYNEVETIACKITDLTREENMRYRDIAILCGNTEEYNHIIETVFDEYKIPYFTDSTVTLSDHPIAMQILSLFDIFEKDWRYEDMFRYLKAGFIYTDNNGIVTPLADVDFLENYVLKYGIRGKKRWLSEWERNTTMLDAAFDAAAADDIPDDAARANEIRRRVTEPLKTLSERVAGEHDAEYFARAVFEFLCDINLDRGLRYEISAMQKSGDVNGAERFTRLWNLMLEVLDQTTVALRGETLTFSEYGEYVSAGLGACSIRTIPSGIDQVYVGSVEKSSAREVKVMFVAGANDGSFPDIIPKEGYFSNNDRNTLSQKCGITIAPDSKKKLERQYFKVYAAMCAVCERLYLSRPLKDSDGKTLTQSAMITDIEGLFPNLKKTSTTQLNETNTAQPDETNAAQSNKSCIYISTPEATIHKMIVNKYAMSRRNPVWEAAYDWYGEHGEWKNLLSLVGRARWYMYPDLHLDSDIAAEMYKGKLTYSASRINTFSQCPFMYFMKYGLHLKEREVWDITPADVGSYAHDVIRLFCEAVENGADSAEEKIAAWRALTDEERVKILDEIIDKTRENTLNNNIRDKEKTASVLKRTGKNIQNAAFTVHRALSAGNYAQDGMEREFCISVSDNADVRGKIDRVDMYSTDTEIKLRVIDYKTGSTKFDVVNIANGIDMQMVIYAMAAKTMAAQMSGKKVFVSGIYYNHVHNKSVVMPLDDKEKEKKQKDKDADVMLDGVTFIVSENDLYEHYNALSDDSKCDFMDMKSKVRSADEINGLIEKVHENIVDADERIRSGEISCTPYADGSRKSCEYCDFKEVCSFANRAVPREKHGKAEEIWAEMKSKSAKKPETEG